MFRFVHQCAAAGPVSRGRAVYRVVRRGSQWMFYVYFRAAGARS